jgi:hypothetical protein
MNLNLKESIMLIVKSTLILMVLSAILAACTTNTSPKEPFPLLPSNPIEIRESNSQDIIKVEDYFPFSGNIHKTFEGKGNEYAQFQTFVDYLTEDVIQIRNSNPGTESVSIYQIHQEGLKRVFFQGETYNVFDYTNFRNQNEYIIKYPLTIGNSWSNDDGSIDTITALDKEIDLPYGILTALEITNQSEFSTVKYYYAKGLGHVKTSFTSQDAQNYTVTSELKNVEKGAPFAKVLTIYFPNFEKNEILFINRTILMNTNTKIENVLQDEFKNVPPNSNLTPLLSPQAKILSIAYDIENRVVTIDFSKELTENMNAGASLESMILKSIATTIGHYFQTEKVSITIEGDSYESGHIKLDQGEYIQFSPTNFEEFSSIP